MTNICQLCVQLRQQNHKLLSQLLSANNKISCLQKFRFHLSQIVKKFDQQLDDDYRQQINLLEDNYNQLENVLQLDCKEDTVDDREVDISCHHNQDIESSSDESEQNVQFIRNSLLQRLSIFKNDLNSVDESVKTDVSQEKNIKLSANNNKNVLNSVNRAKKVETSDDNNEEKTVCEEKLKRTKKSSSNRPRFKCDYPNCKFKAHIRRLVSDHVNAIHTGERPYVCSFANCGKAYASLCYLNKHKLHVHSNQRFKCEWPQCEVEVKSRKSLKVHMRRHTGEKTFDCDFPGCNFRGTNVFSINDHKNKHTGEKPYKCKHEGCGAMFSYRSTRFTHYLRAHSDVRRFLCDWPGCDSAFKDNQALRLHKCIHTGEKPMQCEWPGCDYRCSNGSLLKKHKLVHTQEKKYVCSWPECDMKYSSLSSLKIHLMKHRGEKPNECQICGKRFREKNNLKRHYRTHNRNNDKV